MNYRKFLPLFSQRTGTKHPPAPEQLEEATVRNSVFSTSHNPRASRLSLLHRQQVALSRTFQKGIDSIKAVNRDGTPAEGVDYAMDDAYPDLTQAKLINSSAGYIPIAQLEWYANQGFIGWQMCGLLAQNWLIDKICGVPAQDAVRKGYDITLNDGTKLDPDVLNEMRLHDKRMNICGKLKMFIKKGRIFGIRHALFIIEGIDYEAPFNPDGIKPGSYKGITQIDPYWMAPILGREAAANPASPEFYEPTWWLINGIRVHRSHFVIMRSGDEVVDILKPAYLYGGIPIPQKIYERVYAAERAANEAPLLLLSKRMTTLKTDTTEIFNPNSSFAQQMEQWGQWQNNFGVKVVGLEDEVQQFETAMGEVNDTINTQFALVCSAGNCPVTKIMGTPPKGMDATGEYDEANYHEEIESIQEEIGTPFVERHHLCLMRSYIAPKFGIAPLDTEINWKPLDSYTTKELAEINEIKSRSAKTYADIGAIDGFDVRQGLITDPDSGYNGLDPIVEGGPGDREHEQEVAEQLLENSNAPQESKEQKHEQVMDGADPVAGVMYCAADRILLLQKADDHHNAGQWEFPGGHLDDGETAEQAAEREFWEETGGKALSRKRIGADGKFTLFIAQGKEFKPRISAEHQNYGWFAVDDLPDPLHKGTRKMIRMALENAATPNS